MDRSNESEIAFISYYHGEKSIADKVKSAIDICISGEKINGPRSKIYMADDKMYAGAEWLNEIRRKLEKCRLLVLVCSPSSIKRGWLAFECGFALERKQGIIVFSHSGLSEETVNEYMSSIHCKSVNYSLVSSRCKNPLKELNHRVSKLLKAECAGLDRNDSREDLIKKVEFDLRRDIATGTPFRPKAYGKDAIAGGDFNFGERSHPEKYRKCTVSRKSTSEVGECSTISINVPHDSLSNASAASIELQRHPEALYEEESFSEFERSRLDRLKKMSLLISRNRWKSVKSVETGLAIGIQNCIYFDNNVYVGVRYKSNFDSTKSNTSLSKGEFNTGYKLVRSGDEHTEQAKSIGTLQDLFNSGGNAKYLVRPYSGNKKDRSLSHREETTNFVYEEISSRLKTFGSQLFKIELQISGSGERETCYGSIFINNSCWYPRYEIGIWKYIDITEKESKRNIKDEHFLTGIGEDAFQDYRGNIVDPEEELNFWIWSKNGEICYRSYPEERFVPRRKPLRRMYPERHSVLISSKELTLKYGLREFITQFAPDEKLVQHDEEDIISTQSGQPATRLLTWF